MPDLKSIIHSDPDIHSGDPVFVGTRVPVHTLMDYIEGGDSLEVFLENFPSVSREQAIGFLEEAGRRAGADRVKRVLRDEDVPRRRRPAKARRTTLPPAPP